jgi:hypothetical protein
VLVVDDRHVAFCEYNGSVARIICVAVATLANEKLLQLASDNDLLLCRNSLSFPLLLELGLWCFEGTFNNISVISWRTVLLVEETGVHGKNHQLAASHLQPLSYYVEKVVSRSGIDITATA